MIAILGIIKPKNGAERKGFKEREIKNHLIITIKMKSLEEILMDFGCADDVFDDEGNFTDNGYMTYHRLVKFLYEIAILTRVDVEPIIRELDEICDLSY